MRKEFYGPLPVVIGVLIIAVALLAPARAPPPPACACPVLTVQEFQALDASGYAGAAPGSTLVVDGRVSSVYPSPLIAAPYRIVQFEGSSLRFNVTAYNAATGPVGEWVRISATQDGTSEAGGPDTGHRWTHEGKSAPPGQSVVSLAALAGGIAVAGWGGATVREYGKVKERARKLEGRLQNAKQARAGDRAASKAAGMGKELDGAATMLRRGQYDSVETSVESVEAQLARSKTVAKALDAAREALEAEERRGVDAHTARELFDRAESDYAGGDVPGAEKSTEVAFSIIRMVASLREYTDAIVVATAARAAEGPRDEEIDALVALAKEKLAAGKVEDALLAAEKAFRRARDNAPGAPEAREEIEQLKDFLQLRPEFDRAREVRDRVRDSEELYRLGQFDRARAEARVGLWLADANTLTTSEFEEMAKRRFAARGYTVDPAGAQPPPMGFLAVAREKVVVVCGPWRDFPGERVMFALKDFFAEGGAARAIVYSSAFTNTSTDPRIEVVDAGGLVEVLREAALEQVAGAEEK